MPRRVHVEPEEQSLSLPQACPDAGARGVRNGIAVPGRMSAVEDRLLLMHSSVQSWRP